MMENFISTKYGDVELHVTEEMKKATEAKFKKWDSVIENDTLATGTEEEINQVYQLLKDPTIYAYAFFKNPRNVRERFKAYPYQDVVMNDDEKEVFFEAANQIGKSEALCVEKLHKALINPGWTILLTSKTFPQSKDLLRKIKSLLQNSTLDYQYDIGDTETKTEIYFKHFEEYEEYDEELDKTFSRVRELPQSRILCVPATEAALSYAADDIGVDELCFYDDGSHFYKQIIIPRTFTTKGRIKVYSNPNGQQGVGWELHNDSNVKKYNFNFLDCPTNTVQEFERECSRMTREQIDSTMLARFTSPEGGFLTLKERKEMQEERPSMIPSIVTAPLYIFFDWAKSRDRTVRIVASPKKSKDDSNDWADEVYVHEMKEYPQGTPYTKIIDEDLKDLILDVGPINVGMVGWDNTGVGRGLEDFTKRVEQLGIMAMPVEFSLENKSRIYTLFKLLAEQRRLKIPYDQECDKQLSMLRFKKSPRGHLQVHHENERDRDDFPDAIAGVCSLIIQPESPPVSATIVGVDDDEEWLKGGEENVEQEQ